MCGGCGGCHGAHDSSDLPDLDRSPVRVDSSVVSFLANQYAEEVLLIMQDGLSVGIGEKDFAVDQAKQLGIPLEIIEYNEFDFSVDYQKNPENRCYYCKQLLHDFLEKGVFQARLSQTLDLNRCCAVLH